MRERYRTMLPERALVDKPSANPDLMSHREYGPCARLRPIGRRSGRSR